MFGLMPINQKNHIAKRISDFDNFFDAFSDPFFRGALKPLHELNFNSSFKVDVKDLGSSYELTAELPGFKKEDISLDYENGYLTIAAESNTQKEEKSDSENYLHRERYFGSVSRSFYIDDVDSAKTSAEFRDGVLKVELPKLAKVEEKTKKIAIK
jgi:HSP20 family protein